MIKKVYKLKKSFFRQINDIYLHDKRVIEYEITTKMKTLDLHGVKHHEVDRLVENFILLNSEECPIKIITGKSIKMNNLTIGCNK